MSKFMNLVSVAGVCLMLVATHSYAGQWIVDSAQSELNFVTIKQTHIAEINRFDTFQGGLDKQGNFSLKIDLASVDTKIQLRNDRVRKLLFNVEKFSNASLIAAIDNKMIDKLEIGQSKRVTVKADLILHGEKNLVILNMLISKLTNSKLLVMSAEPALVNAANFSLVAGIEKLRTLAGLTNITHTVPVTFYLVLNAAN